MANTNNEIKTAMKSLRRFSNSELALLDNAAVSASDYQTSERVAAEQRRRSR